MRLFFGRLFSSGSLRVNFAKNGEETKQVCGDFVGKNVLEVAHEFGVDLEGACDGACACSTCHVILEAEVFQKLPPASDEEEDMLDLAFGLTETSRLGCQIKLTPEHDGITIRLPSATRNLWVDGEKPKPH